MEMADEAGFFAVLIPRKNKTAYILEVTYDNGTKEELQDPYAFASPVYRARSLKKFECRYLSMTIYEKMGAHPMTIERHRRCVFFRMGPLCHASQCGRGF